MNAAQITRAIRKKLNIPVVWGGVHPTVEPGECLEHCDIAVIGEGELTILEILERMENGEPLNSIQGINYLENGEIIRNPLRPLLGESDFPLIDNDYSSDFTLWQHRGILPINTRVLRRCVTRDYMTLTSFGCPFSCSYCINNLLNKMYCRKVRFRKIADVIEELVLARKRMPFLRQVTFDDDAFISRKNEELEEFADRYRRRVNLPFFVAGVNPNYVSDDKMRILLKAGMNRIKMGIQSGSQISKDLYNRRIPNEQIIRSAGIINRYQRRIMLVAYDLILDNPFEGKKDVLETINLLSRLPRPFTLNLSSLTFFPGTDIYQMARKAGYVVDNKKDIYLKLYHGVDHTYLNFIIVLFSVLKVPPSLLKFLVSERPVNRYAKVPSWLFSFFLLLGFARRGLDFLFKGDLHTLWRLIKYNPLRPWSTGEEAQINPS